MAYTFEQVFAADPSNPSNIAQNAAITIFAPGDATMTPIALTDPDGAPLTNPIPVNANGFGSAFMADLDRVAWAGGGFTGFFTSYEGMKQVAVDAQSAAEEAVTTAQTAAATTVTAATINGAGRLILTKADASTVDAGPAVGPQGAPGAPGLNGANVLPTDTAVAQAVTTGTATASALLAGFVAGQTRPAEGTQTTGQNLTLGSFGYIQSGGATNSVSGGSPNYENVIGGNVANVNTATSNLTGAPTLVAPDGNWNSIWGGYDNVVNGWANQVQSYHSKINTGANHCTIGGGSAHEMLASVAYGSIGGGTNNKIGAAQGTVAGGSTNTASGTSSSVGGGLTNTASGAGSTISGGQTNTANASNTTIGGGTGNQATNTGATVAGGATNQATNINAVVGGGSANIASGNGALVTGGLTNTASGTSAAVLGGRDNLASGNYTTVWGREALADTIGQTSYANGKFTAVGDAQAVNYVLRKETTNATPTLIYTDGVGTFMNVPVDTTIAFDILVVARRTDADGESAAYKITGCIDRGAGSTAALVGTPVVTVLAEDMPAWDCTIAASTSGSLRITVTGEAAKTIRWVARASLVSVTG